MVVPRWIQLVGLPVALIVAWSIAGAVRHVVFLFIVAGLIALLLNPIVRGLGRAWIPRGFAVAIVYLSFAALVVAAGVALSTVVVDQTKSAANRVDNYFTEEHGQPPITDAERDVDRLQLWLNTHHLERVNARKPALDFLNNARVEGRLALRVQGDRLGGGRGSLVHHAAVLDRADHRGLDLHAARHAAVSTRDRSTIPPRPFAPADVARRARAGRVRQRGALLLSRSIGTSAASECGCSGSGWFREPTRTRSSSGLFVAFTELIPYLGPWLRSAAALLLCTCGRSGLGDLLCSFCSSTRSRDMSSSRT
jgi:hypothetical protein